MTILVLQYQEMNKNKILLKFNSQNNKLIYNLFNKKLLDFASRCGLLNNREIRKIVEPRE